VQSLATYYIQLALFSGASASLLVFGAFAVCGARWTTRGPRAVGGLAAMHLCSAGLLIAWFGLDGRLVLGTRGPALAVFLAAALIVAGITAWFIARAIDRRSEAAN
jgi:hypothetical protein